LEGDDAAAFGVDDDGFEIVGSGDTVYRFEERDGVGAQDDTVIRGEGDAALGGGQLVVGCP